MAHDPASRRSVEADMERIFGPANRLSAPRDLASPLWAAPRLPMLQRRHYGFGRWITFAALATLALGLGVVTAQRNVQRVAFESSLKTAAVTPKPVGSHGVPAAHTVHELDAYTERVAPSVAMEHPIASIRRSMASAIRQAPVTHVSRQTVRVIPITPPRSKSDHPAQLAEEPAAGPCVRGDENDACIYQDVVAADRRLRGAYADAVQNGVASHNRLISIERRWHQARIISLEEPDETIRRYDRLTDELDDLNQSVPRR